MWVFNVILIFAAVAFFNWLLLNHGGALANALGVFLAGCQSALLAIGVILLEAIKAAVVSALIGGAMALIFWVAGAPEPITKGVATVTACLAFTLLLLKALWENLNNFRWTMRHEVRNRYRRR
jgi:preprotein translocase subunit SecG